MEAAYYNLTQLLAWAQAYDYDEVNSVSSAAASVLDVYTSVAKSMLAKVYGRGYDELVGEAVAHLTAAASQGSPVARLTLYGKVDGSRDFLIPTSVPPPQPSCQPSAVAVDLLHPRPTCRCVSIGKGRGCLPVGVFSSSAALGSMIRVRSQPLARVFC